MAETITVGSTGNQDIDGLLWYEKWVSTNITYSFPTDGSFFEYGGESGNNFEVLNATQQSAVAKIFKMISGVTNLTFTKVTESATNHATLRFAMSDNPGTAWAYFPNTGPSGGDSWYNNISGSYDVPIMGTYAYYTFMHEVGHALGLVHGHEASNPYGAMTYEHDSMEYSIMTYKSYVGSDAQFVYNEYYGYAQTLMMYDIAALQHMYGADFTTNASNSVYKWNPETGQMSINGVGQGLPGDNRVFMTVWDGGGKDTYDLSNYANGVRIDLRPGEWTTTSPIQIANLGNGNFARGNIANALQYKGDARSLIESAIGGDGDDMIFGNTAANVLSGRAGVDQLFGFAGNDQLFGGLGADIMEGGTGNDTYGVEDAGDKVTELVNQGTDLVEASEPRIWRQSPLNHVAVIAAVLFAP